MTNEDFYDRSLRIREDFYDRSLRIQEATMQMMSMLVVGHLAANKDKLGEDALESGRGLVVQLMNTALYGYEEDAT